MHKRFLALICLIGLHFSGKALAQTTLTTEEHFHDLFITAGYSTAFGAALGAAFLGLTDDPTQNLRYIAIGASLGFIGGSLLGTYILVAPNIVFQSDHQADYAQFAAPLEAAGSGGQLIVSPTWSLKARRLDAWQADWILAQF